MEATFLWFFLLHILFATVQLCAVPSKDSHLIGPLYEELLTLPDDTSEDPNPSIYLALRLSRYHNLEKEHQYFQRLKNTTKITSQPAEMVYQESPGTGQLALYLLALRAACSNMNKPEHKNLITQLKLHLNKEKKQIDSSTTGRPLTNFYQYSLGVLALCVHQIKVEESVIHKLLHTRQRKKFHHHGLVSVDTEAMAGLAFVCLRSSRLYHTKLIKQVRKATQAVKKTILRAQTPAGTFGNIYSSPLAVQFLIASGVNQNDAVCTRVMDVLLQSLKDGMFRNALIKSQLLPALQRKSYFDIYKMDCRAETGSWYIRTSLSSFEASSPRTEMINVNLTVMASPEVDPLYTNSVSVLKGSSLLDVLKTAEKDVEKPLSFKTHKTLSGPMLVEVMGLNTQEMDHKYWKLSRDHNIALAQGIADYVLQVEQSILLELVQW